MATGGSDETYDITCSPCERGGNNVEAIAHCVDCNESFCDACYNFHQNLTDMAVHEVLDKEGMQAKGIASKTDEENEDIVCTPCAKGSKNMEAIAYCVDCKESFCELCYNSHKHFSGMTNHEVLDKVGMQTIGLRKTGTLRMPTETCNTHPGKLIVIYCESHEDLCCTACASANHRSCSTVYIPDASRGISKGNATLEALADSLKLLHDEVSTMKTSRQTHLQKSSRDQIVIGTEIKTVMDSLVNNINRLRKVSMDMVNSKFDPQQKVLNDEINFLDKILTDVQPTISKLNSAGTNKAQMFINMKRAQHLKQGLSKKLQQKVSLENTPTNINLWTHPEMNNVLDTLKTFDSIVTVQKVYRTKSRKTHKVRISSDSDICSITAYCILPDSTYLVTDWNNKCLKRLDISYNVIGYSDMHDSPWGVTRTAPDEVAVTVTSKSRVKFFSIKDHSMTKKRFKSFSTKDACRGIYFSNGELFISCGGMPHEGSGCVACYSLKGNCLRIVQIDSCGKNVFSVPRQIAGDKDGTTILTADQKFGVVAFDRNGKQIRSFNDSSLSQPFSLCVLENGNVLVTGRYSNNVIQFDSNGKKMTELLQGVHIIKNPEAVWQIPSTSSLVVTTMDSDFIKVFDLV